MRPANSGVAETGQILSYSLPVDLRQALSQALRDWDTDSSTARIWEGDRSLRGSSNDKSSLAWLDLVARQLNDISKFKALSAEVKEDGFTHILVLGGDGSTLTSELFSRVFEKQNGCPELMVLDSTDPVDIRQARLTINLSRTLFCVIGSTATAPENASLVQYFFAECQAVIGDRAGHHFIAITDPKAELAGLAAKLKFRYVFSSEMGAGGCFSAFSDAGLVPFAAAGYDTEKLLKRAMRMVQSARNNYSHENPAVRLGILLAIAAKFHRRKVTLLCSRTIGALGTWIEQSISALDLIAINHEPVMEVSNYGSDRLFVHVIYSRDQDRVIEKHIAALEEDGQPVVRIEFEELYDVAQTIFEWQFATAVAGAYMRLDPCSVPAEIAPSKQLDEYELVHQNGLKLIADASNRDAIFRTGESVGGLIRRHLDRLKPGDFFGLLAHLPKSSVHEDLLGRVRRQIMESKQTATMLSFAPHLRRAFSGDSSAGVFLQITCDEAYDVLIPGSTQTFGAVKAQHARRDFQFLAEHHVRLLRVHLGSDVEKGLHQLCDLICAAVEH